MIRNATPAASTNAGNPFSGTGSGGGSTSQTSLVNQYRVQLPNGSIVNVSSLAEVDALRASFQQNNVINLSGNSSNGADGWNTAADAAQTVAGYLAGRNLRDRVDDADDARTRRQAARAQVEALRGTYPDLVNGLLSWMDAQTDLDDAQTDALDTQITAVDIAAGAGAVRLVSAFAKGDMSGLSGSNGPLLAAGAVGVGALLLSGRNRNTSGRR